MLKNSADFEEKRMRVIAGTARSLNLIVPEGIEVRPTLDRTKETIFNMIQHRIWGANFLDIFSGSGAIGIESLSRGAKKAFFVEKSKEALRCIEFNLNHTHLLDKAQILAMDFVMALDVIQHYEEKMDLIFLDPPFNGGFEAKAISLLYAQDILNQDGLLICESSADTSFEFMEELENYCIVKEKIYKTSKFTFIERKPV